MSASTGKRLVGEIVDDVVSKLSAMSDRDLRKVIRRCGQLTQTNCGWQEYALGDALIAFAKNNLDYRRWLAEVESEGQRRAKADDARVEVSR